MSTTNPQSSPIGKPGSSPDAFRPAARIWTLAIAAGLIAGLAAWLGGEASLDAIEPARRPVKSKGMILNVTDRWGETMATAWNAGLAFSILGGSVGTSLGAAGGLARGSARKAAIAALMGLVVGAVGVAGMSGALLAPFSSYRFHHPDEASKDLLFPLLVRAAIWTTAGISGGLAFGIGAGDRRMVAKAALGGAVGALIGAVAFDLTSVMVVSGTNTAGLVSATWEARLAARLAVAVFAAAGVAMAVVDRRVRPDVPS